MFLVAPDPEDETHARKLLASVKLNIATKPATMVYRIEPSKNGCSRIKWDGTSKFSAQDLTDVEGGHGLPATDLLSEYLSSGSKKATDVARAARDAWGISESTLKRARKKLGVKAVKKGNVWFLKLPKDGSDKAEREEARSRGSQGVLFKDDPLDPLARSGSEAHGEEDQS